MKADLVDSEGDFEDEFVKKLQKSVWHIKESREMENHFMLYEQLLRDERAIAKAEGKAEVVLELLEDIAEIPEEIQEKILNETDLEMLTKWIRIATKVDSIEQFLEEM